MLCKLIGHNYQPEFGTPFELGVAVGKHVSGSVGVSVLVCKRCGKFKIAPTIRIDIPEGTVKIIEKTVKKKVGV